MLKAFTLLSAHTIFSWIVLEPKSIHGVGAYDQWCSLERQGILCSPSAPAQGHEMDFSGDQRVGSSAELLLYYCRKPAAAQRYLIHPCRLKPSWTIIPAVPAHAPYAPTPMQRCPAILPPKISQFTSPDILPPDRIFLRNSPVLGQYFRVTLMQSNTIRIITQ